MIVDYVQIYRNDRSRSHEVYEGLLIKGTLEGLLIQGGGSQISSYKGIRTSLIIRRVYVASYSSYGLYIVTILP